MSLLIMSQVLFAQEDVPPEEKIVELLSTYTTDQLGAVELKVCTDITLHTVLH
jgi:hypothetical protein